MSERFHVSYEPGEEKLIVVTLVLFALIFIAGLGRGISKRLAEHHAARSQDVAPAGARP